MMPLQMSFQSHARKFTCTSFDIGCFLFLQMVIRPPGIFLLHISGSVDY